MLATGKERSSPSLRQSVVRATKADSKPTNGKKNRKESTERNKKGEKKGMTPKQYSHWKVGTINVLTASDDMLLHECLRQC